jgi:hypothetical protein
MRVPARDRIATVLVAAAVVIYLLWVAGATLPGMEEIRVTGLVVLGLGFAASPSAVVPGFDGLLHGGKPYLVGTSLLGVVAFAAGVVMLARESGAALGLVMASMVLLWLIPTIHHTVLARSEPAVGMRPSRHGPRPAGVS